MHLRRIGTWPEATFCAAWVKTKRHVTVVSSLCLRHAWLAPSPPPRGVNVVEIALPLLPTGGWAAGVYQSSYLSPCSGWWPFARVEWQSGRPSPGHTLTPPN